MLQLSDNVSHKLHWDASRFVTLSCRKTQHNEDSIMHTNPYKISHNNNFTSWQRPKTTLSLAKQTHTIPPRLSTVHRILASLQFPRLPLDRARRRPTCATSYTMLHHTNYWITWNKLNKWKKKTANKCLPQSLATIYIYIYIYESA
jgi:hypothetical protein